MKVLSCGCSDHGHICPFHADLPKGTKAKPHPGSPGETRECDGSCLPANTNEIRAYLLCRLCVAEIPPDESAQSWSKLDIGWTVKGLQVWCARHDCNVMHMDFEGVKHTANTTRKLKEGELH